MRRTTIAALACALLACVGCDPKLVNPVPAPTPSPEPLPTSAAIVSPAKPPPPKFATGDPRGPDFGGWRAVGIYGLTVDIPASWPVNAAICGTPQRDTVLIEPYVVPACASGRKPRVDSVTVRPYRSRVDPKLSPSARRAIDGHPAEVITAGNVTTVLVPDLKAAVEIDVHDAQLAQHINNSLRVLSVDSHGCATQRPDTVQLPTGQAPHSAAARTVLVPGRSTSLTTCGYDDGRLRVGATMSGADVRKVAAALNAAPPGGSLNLDGSECQSPRAAPSYILTFGYADQQSVTVWVRIDGCGVLGASNGMVVHRRTFDVVEAVGTASGLPEIGFRGNVASVAE
jgi:hypothetical protein